MRIIKTQVLITLMLLLAGCSSGTNAPPPDETSASRPSAPPPEAPDLTSAMLEQPPPEATAPAVEPAAPQPEPEPEKVAEVASVGAGKKGHGYGGGMITEPVRAYFRTREQIVFEITIPNAMKTYKAMDPDNKGPKSHEDFMEKIIKENYIELPSLPVGAEYRYDPETEDLMVLRPKR